MPSTACTASRSKVNTWSASSSAVSARSTPTRSPSRSGWTTARWPPSCTTPSATGGSRSTGRTSADRRPTSASGSLEATARIGVAIPRIFEGLPVRVQRPQSFAAAGSAARIQAAARHAARSSPGAQEALRRSAGGAREDPAQRRAGRERGSRRPVRAGDGGPWRRAPRRSSPAAIATAGTRPACVRRIMTDLAARAFRRPVTAAELDRYVALVHEAQEQESSFDEGLVVGIQAVLVSPHFLFRIERDRPATATADVASASRSTSSRRGCRTSSGAACPTTTLRRAADAGTLRNPQVLARPGPADAARSEVARARRELRRAVAAVPRARIGHAAIATRSPSSTTTCGGRCGGRPSCSSSTSSATTAASSTSSTADYSFLNERLARALRHRRTCRVREFRRVDRSTGTPRGGVADPGQRADGHRRYRDAHVAGDARQVDPRQPARARRRRRRRPTSPNLDETVIGDLGVDARAAGGAPQEPDVRVVPPPDGPARLRPGELRRASARGGPRTASCRSTPPARCPTGGRSAGQRSCARF